MFRRGVWAVLTVVVAAVALAVGCASNHSTVVATDASTSTNPTATVANATTTVPLVSAATGTLRITQVQTACCYTEGQVSYLSITGPTGPIIADRSYRPIDDHVVLFSTALPEGRYEVVSYQRPCDGNCDHLDNPTDRCSGSFAVAVGQTTAVAVMFSPTKGCTMQIDATVTSSVPDEIALTGDLHDCGFDYATVATGLPRPARQCFVDAYNKRDAAQVITYNETPDTGDGNDQQIVRVDGKGIVTVYRRILGPGRSQTPWTKQTCAGLTADKSAGYKLTSCTSPQLLQG